MCAGPTPREHTQRIPGAPGADHYDVPRRTLRITEHWADGSWCSKGLSLRSLRGRSPRHQRWTDPRSPSGCSPTSRASRAGFSQVCRLSSATLAPSPGVTATSRSGPRGHPTSGTRSPGWIHSPGDDRLTPRTPPPGTSALRHRRSSRRRRRTNQSSGSRRCRYTLSALAHRPGRPRRTPCSDRTCPVRN